ncbi:uncharacterized protein MYCFIDRAFT_169741 [Pseudocercospora fijiensis CIRAD86]|uniref:Uncharacterized protein n=1 Tax=Pseudocercospora fijiensis (strain CIRAD86) TaxID=383855 RepID=N1QAM0_PSEFD|nr:uncharacterized protein MYCFIDRAFT_169741 [Pseudocercospora fijiensis CIRAD86]EME88027.1 hypothetical protein MYCFIDRAFT_169741 [Pseudocercospora fijiensis CIRAD86]
MVARQRLCSTRSTMTRKQILRDAAVADQRVSNGREVDNGVAARLSKLRSGSSRQRHPSSTPTWTSTISHQTLAKSARATGSDSKTSDRVRFKIPILRLCTQRDIY